jgi:hypothetical protein
MSGTYGRSVVLSWYNSCQWLTAGRLFYLDITHVSDLRRSVVLSWYNSCQLLMLHICYSCYSYVTHVTHMLLMLLICYSCYSYVTHVTHMLLMLLICYSCYSYVTHVTHMLLIVKVWAVIEERNIYIKRERSTAIWDIDISWQSTQLYTYIWLISVLFWLQMKNQK